MTVQEAKLIIGDRARWELRNMIKALSSFTLFNTPEDDTRLKACKVMLRSHIK